MDPQMLATEIQLASMLVNLGIVTVDKIKGYFADQGHDEETLTALLAEFDQRIARRS